MMRASSRRGSALLIVLGMMAFILVSAVAFSAYMRYSRLPSSYLRRTSASRHLAKAALAEAIDMVDSAIGNNPHPGVKAVTYRFPRSGDGSQFCPNYWADRVFIGGTNASDVAVNPDDTVSTLCVEGLAYLPPAIINDVRYWSRRTHTAIWRSMGFDAGRYAFCAVDVSDCLDVNLLLADQGRDSSEYGRISLAHVFENEGHTGFAVQPSAWDRFVENYYDGTDFSKVPFVSVADLCLAMNDNGPSGVPNPFCDYIRNGTAFVKSDTGSDAEVLRNMLFVTDSYFPATNAQAGAVLNLSSGPDQPFDGFGGNPTLDDLMMVGGRFMSRYQNTLHPPELVQLFDYLDRDSVPKSLAMPTVERTPMITGLSFVGNLAVRIEEKDVLKVEKVVDPSDSSKNEYYKITTYSMKVGNTGPFAVNVGAVYPFKYDRGANASFKVQAAATIAFVEGEKAELRRPYAAYPCAIARNDWKAGAQRGQLANFGNGMPGAVTMFSAQKPLSVPKLTGRDVKEEDALLADTMLDFGDVDATFESELPPSAYDDNGAKPVAAFRNVAQTDEEGNVLPGRESIEVTAGWTPAADSLANGILSQAGILAAGSPVLGKTFHPVVQVWARIVDGSGKTVDLVPACGKDDENALDLPAGGDTAGFSERPVLRFNSAASACAVSFAASDFASYGMKEAADFAPAAYIADDPRFNYAPENMLAEATLASASIKDEWFSKQRSSSRDGDIFMATSDAGYLQSRYELANLVRTSGLSGGKLFGVMCGGGYDGKPRTSFGNTPADSAMWRTYTQYDLDGNSGEIERYFPEVVSGTRGYRVNPYTPSSEIMLLALANTPIDWWAASTNDVGDSVKSQMLGSLQAALKYTFSEHAGSQARMKHGTRANGANNDNGLTALALKMISRFRGAPDKSWRRVFDDMDWDGGDLDEIDGVNLDCSLHTVDRKFLHGYWKECFDARQQLFLIFVRAEPMMMGGGGLGQTPPQLGARAVALVWRDPAATKEDAGGSQPRPHRTRLLFYRQFD